MRSSRTPRWQEAWVGKIAEEFDRGFRFVRDFELAATIFGSTRLRADSSMYRDVTNLAYALSKEGFAIITGGGGGVMEAANKGAFQAGGRSAGINIRLPEKQVVNRYVKESADFSYFFVRKVMLSFASEVYIFFPGGFGTLDECFEMLTLAQTKKIKPIPIILVDKAYWTPLLSWVEREVYGKRRAISKEDMRLWRLADNAEEALGLVNEMVVKSTKKR